MTAPLHSGVALKAGFDRHDNDHAPIAGAVLVLAALTLGASGRVRLAPAITS